MTAQKEQDASHVHAVHFYAHESELTAFVGGQLAEALEQGAAAVVIATGAHRTGFENELERLGVDPDGRLQLLDASSVLQSLMPHGRLDPAVFGRVVGGVLRGAARSGWPVWAYGEMVALLWADGNVSAALELEQLWNRLASELKFSLLCAYPSSIMSGPDHGPAVAEVCRLHTTVIPQRTRPQSSVALNGFEPSRQAPRRAREFVTEVLREHGDGALIDDAALIVSELATNAVLHAGSRFEVALHFGPQLVTLSVSDLSLEPPTVGEPAPWDPAGRGLIVVDSLASGWGCTPARAGKTVWAELTR